MIPFVVLLKKTPQCHQLPTTKDALQKKQRRNVQAAVWKRTSQSIIVLQ
jgi:hypothetical protein